MVLVFEYQLSEVGLKLSMVAVSLAVASQLLRQEPSIFDEDQFILSPLPFAPIRDKVILLPVAIFAAMMAIYMREYLIYTPPLSKTLLLSLAINTLAAVLTFQISGSSFRQAEPLATFSGIEEDHDEDGVDPALETISIQCVIALGSVLVNLTVGTTSSMSIWQYIGFWTALGTLLWIGRQFKPCAVDDVYYASVNGSHDYHLQGFNASRLHEEQRGIRWSVLSQAIFVGVCMLLSISPLLFAHTSPQPSSHWIPRNDLSPSNTTRTLDFVVSRFNEPAAQLAQQINTLHSLPNKKSLNTRLIVYSTGNDSTELYKSLLQQSLHPSIEVSIIQRPNIGREAATYLTHILSPPHPFASHTFFLQAEMHFPSLILPRTSDYFVANTGFLSLSPTHQTSNTCIPQPWDKSTWSESSAILSPIFSALNLTNCVECTYTYRGQFIVSAQRILSQSPDVYQLLLENLVDANAMTHQMEHGKQPWLPSKQDSLNAPLFGFTMERLWGLVFGCQGKMEGCTSLMAGAVGAAMGGRRGDVGECQCLDAIQSV
jgi:hypothetical protein